MTAELARPTPVASATTTITGTVSDPGGYPLAGITIVLFEGGRGEDGMRLDTTTTDDIGGYRFTRVHATAGDTFRVEATDDSGGHVSTCSTFTVGTAATTLHTTMPVAGHVQGTVVIQDGATTRPATQVCVTAAGEDVVQAVNVSANGTFRIGGLPAGKYTLLLHDDVHLDTVSAHWLSVTVAAARTTTIEDQVLPNAPQG
jgi:hypothetical protein